MVFAASGSPDITESLPASIGSSVLIDYPPEAGWDVTFGSLGFTLRPSESAPYQRGTEDGRKQQIDTSDSPGEQSLSSWWVRSQDSWDSGSGARWYEPGARDGETVNRFGDSFGIDPWTRGQLTLLKRTAPLTTLRGSANYLSSLEVGGNPGYVEAYGNQAVWTPTGAGTATTVTLPGGNATQPAGAGGVAWIGHDGGISMFTPGSAIATPLTLTGNARVWWVKARLIVAIGPALYEVGASTTGVIPAVGTAIYTHPSSAWVWTDVTETSGAILAVGYAGGDSGIFRFSIENDDTGTPILSKGSQVGRTPPGERITCASVYLGSSLVLGTSSGVRVGEVSDAGDVKYGPLTVETVNPVLDVTFRDRFAYLTVTGAQQGGVSGAVRVDLSAPVGDTGFYAWAWDASVDSPDPCTSICLVGDRVFLAVGGYIHGQSATELVPRGWLNSGRIRFGTVEPKAFRLVRTVVATNGGTASLTVSAPDASEHRVVEFTDEFRTEDDVAVQIPGRPVNQYISLNVYMSPSPTNVSPVLSALSVKAMPAASRIRLYQFPLSVYDYEKDRYNNTYGRQGGAFARLAALESLEETGRPIAVVDNRTGESFIAQIDSVDFTSTNAPQGANANNGGTATVRVRRL